MEKVLLAHGLGEETDTAIMMLYKNVKVRVCSPDGDADFFAIFAGVLQKDILALFQFIMFLRTSIDQMKENGLTLKKQEADDILQKLPKMQTTQMI